jgi:hypothetical protein
MKRRLLLMIVATPFLLMACSGAGKQSGSAEQVKLEEDNRSSEEVETDEPVDSVDMADVMTEDQSNNTEDPLSTYSSEKIEYARVWLQVIGNKGVEVLNVRHISAGEKLNPYEDTSIGYPEDVIVLSGKAMADGVVTYSGNGDGTIHVYDIPSHWPTSEQIEESMKDYTKGIVEGAEKISVETGEDQEVVELMGKMDIER